MDKMSAPLVMLSLLQVVICVAKKSQTEKVFEGTEGSSMDIYCDYQHGYHYTPMYFCKDPCSYSDVLIKVYKADEVFSKGRYFALNTVTAQSFSVTIINLRLNDSGVYYCGVETWGNDILSKVNVTVKNATTSTPTTALLSTLQTTKTTDQSSASTVIKIIADNSTVYEQSSSTAQSTHSSVLYVLPVYGGILGLLLFSVLVALVVFYKSSSTHSTSLNPSAPETQISDPPFHQDEVYHFYDEIMAVNSPIIENSLETYSIIRYAPPTDDDCSPYSLIVPH